MITRLFLPPSRSSVKPALPTTYIMTSILSPHFLIALWTKTMLLAQVDTETSTSVTTMNPLVMIISLLVTVLMIVAMWKVFTKAGEPGWGSIIPILNLYFLCKIAGRPGWWLLLMLIPVVNLIVWIIVCVDIAKNFGKGAGFGIGLALLGFIFFPILAFSDATYQGAATPGV